MLKGLASFSILVQNFFTSLDIFKATFLRRCSSSYRIKKLATLLVSAMGYAGPLIATLKCFFELFFLFFI
jgi:hypothetical protein